MKKSTIACILALVYALFLPQMADAAKQGRSNLKIRIQNTTSQSTSVGVGDTLNIELYIEGRGEEITGTTLFLEFDDKYLELIPAAIAAQVRPFVRGPYMQGTIFQNGTMGDAIGNSGANNVPLFQLVYNEDIQSSFGGDQRAAVGNGVVATFKLKVVRKPESVTTTVRFVRTSPSGSEGGYFKKGDPGSVYSFNNVENLLVSIQGLQLTLEIPDLVLLPGQVDSTLDLDDYTDDPTHPDSTLAWTNTVPVPDSIQVAVNPASHRVVVDPRKIVGEEVIDFIGRAQVELTARTRFDETVSDVVQILVDTAPEFVGFAIPDTIRFFEDRDTTFTLTAIDPDRGAQLTFFPIAGPEEIFAVPDTQIVNQDTIRQVMRLSSKENYSGAGIMRFKVRDQFGLADTVFVQMEVAPVNDPPEFLQAFPEIEIPALAQETLTLTDYVRDIDDPYEALQFAFTGVDSIAFAVKTRNQQLVITPLPPFQGDRVATVVVTDTSNAAAVQQLLVRVLAPLDPQPPKVNVPWLKVNVRAGADASITTLDPLVDDIDTPDDLLTWSYEAVPLVAIDDAALNQRRLQVAALVDSTGYRPTKMEVIDPTALSDSLNVRIYSSSIVTGVPVAGGMPDFNIVKGEADSLRLDDYYFDADHTDTQVTWSAIGNEAVEVQIDPVTHQAVLRPLMTSNKLFEDIVFVVEDPQGQTATDTIRVAILSPGSVLLDLSTLGGSVRLKLGETDTIGLDPLILVGDKQNIAWKAVSRNSSIVFSQLDLSANNLLIVGVRIGATKVILTATDTTSHQSSTDSLNVNVSVSAFEDTLIVQDIGPLTLQANRDTTIDLKSLVLAGDVNNLAWSTPGNDNIGVEIDTLRQEAILRPRVGFTGNAGALIFEVRDVVTQIRGTTTASPILVVGNPSLGGDLLEIRVVINPVLKNFLDVFVRSRRELQGLPFLDVRLGGDPDLPLTPITVTPVSKVENLWIGDMRVSDEVTGVVELSATGITRDTRIALTDTLRMLIERANVRSTFSMTHGDVSVTLPQNGVDAPSFVALIPERRNVLRAKPVAGELVPISDTYYVHAPNARVNRSGEIAFRLRDIPEHAGVYREGGSGQWILVGDDIHDGMLVGEFDAFGRYGVFVDLHRTPDVMLHQNFPNPFNPQTSIRFELPEASLVQLVVYNPLGQAVRTLLNGSAMAGQHIVVWDARDDFGRPVGAGLYLYRLEATGVAYTRKMLLLK